MGRRRFGQGIALVLGGNGHLGAAIVEQLHEEEVQVAFTYRRPSGEVERLAALRHVTSHQLDLTNADAIRALLASLGSTSKIHSVIHAAGIPVPQRFVSQIPRKEWEAAIDFELHSFFDVAQAVIAVMKGQGGGSFVVLTSAAIARFAPRDALSAVPKAAVEQLMRAIAREEGRANIRANCVEPGLVAGGLGNAVIEELNVPNLLQIVAKSTALQRLPTAQDVAGAALFLASNDANAVTGQTIVVDSGVSI